MHKDPDNDEKLYKELDPKLVKAEYSKLEQLFENVLSNIDPIDPSKKHRRQFSTAETCIWAATYQVNKYAILHMLGKKQINHPEKGKVFRHHLKNIWDKVSSLPHVYSIFVEKDQAICSEIEDLSVMTHQAPPAPAAAGGTVDAD